MHTRTLVPSLALATLACFEVPTLDPFEAPPPDLGTLDTWAALEQVDPSGSPSPDEGSSWSGPGEGSGQDGPLDGPSDEGELDELPDPALARLRISEVLIDPEGKDGGATSPEFVELVNPGPDPVALAGLRIDAASWPILDGAELGLADVVLPVGGVLVVRRYASDQDPALAGVSVQGARVFTSFLHGSGLRNGDGRVAIGASSAFADVLAYGVAPESPFDQGWIGEAVATPDSGWSLCRSTIDGMLDADHDDALDWSSCAPSEGSLDTPSEGGSEGESGLDTGTEGESETGAEPEPIAAGTLVIVEVLSNPAGPAADEKAWEYVELINESENEVELAQVRIGDDPSPLAAGIDPLAYLAGEGGCASPTCLAPGRRALIVAQGYVGEPGDALVLATDDSTLADGGLTTTEALVIWDAFDTAISTYRVWPDPSGEPSALDGHSLVRVDPLAPDEPDSWTLAQPSPGT
jgi:hypothetical protein